MRPEYAIATLRRSILQGERQVLRQSRIVARLKATGSDTSVAEGLLARFEQALTQNRADLGRLMST